MIRNKALYIIICFIIVLNFSSCVKSFPTPPEKASPKDQSMITIKIPIGSNTVYVNDEEIHLNNLNFQSAYIDEESQITMVPLRFISEIIGAKIEWLPNTKEIIITQDTKTIQMTVNLSKATINGKEFDLPCAPQIKEERAFVPLKFITQNLGFVTDWIPESKTIILYKRSS